MAALWPSARTKSCSAAVVHKQALTGPWNLLSGSVTSEPGPQTAHLTTVSSGLPVNHYSQPYIALILVSRYHAFIFGCSDLTKKNIEHFIKIMFLSDPISGIFLIAEIFMGLIGNSLLFFLYMYNFLTQPHLKKPIDRIFAHLTLVNVLSIVLRLLPDVMSSFAVRLHFRDAGCKAVLYAYSVTRGLSICTTSLLSVSQAITISSSHSKWAWLKSKMASCICPSLLSIWIINTLLYIPMTENVKAQINLTVVDSRYSDTYCGKNQVRYYTTVSLLSAMMIRDILFVALMMCTSLYMVNLLLRHSRRTQHVHSASLSSQSSSELNATHSILLLVGFFVFFYCSNNFVNFYLFYRPEKNPELLRISGILSSCFPVTCPYILTKNRKIISKCISSLSNFKFTFSTRRLKS